MLPPPTEWMSSIGTLIASPPISVSRANATSPPCTTPTSKLVPPMSAVIRLREPAPERALAAPATMPPAGPDITVSTARRPAARADITPPLDFMMNNGAPMPCSPNPCSNRSR